MKIGKFVVRCLIIGFLITTCYMYTTFCVRERPGCIYDLDDSTEIIMHLIATNKLSAILEGASSENSTMLIKNFSPADIAFESEVLNCEIPVVVAFFKKNVFWLKSIKPFLETLALEYNNRIKFVQIQADTFFKLAELSHIITFPTFLLVRNRKEIIRLEKWNKMNFKNAIRTLTKKALS